VSIQNFIKQFFKNQLLSYIDVGAADDINQRWKKISKNLEFIGFEPNPEEYKKIKNKNFGKFKLFNFAVGDRNGFKKLNILFSSYASSFLKPNFELLKEYPNSERFKIKKKINLKVRKIDSLKLKKIDFIKIDTQGYNLKVLKGASKSLDNILGIEIETEFLNIYEKQDLFEDIKIYLQNKNFYFINFYNLRRWSHSKEFNYGKTIFCNSLFLKKLNEKDLKNYNKILKYVIICILYNVLDLAYKAIKKSSIPIQQKQKIIKFLKRSNKKSFFTKLYISIYNRVSRFFKKQNELFPTF
tara:strand:- start:2592 stop:3485 length:894 start_codon:yes stop_codon:yes gene_type:complete